jgi:cytoskeleton protein RodZ
MADFGTGLREARERSGISLHQLADRTKISVASLEAIERGDTARLPGGIFARSFVRSYASEVGLDPEATLREFLDRFSEPRFAAVSETPMEPSGPPAPRPAGILLKVVVVVLVAIGVIVGLALIKHAAEPSRDPRPDSARRVGRGPVMMPVAESFARPDDRPRVSREKAEGRREN